MRTLLVSVMLLAAPAAYAQGTPTSTFSWRTVQPDLTQTLGDGGTLAFNAIGVGIASDANVTLTYRPALQTLAVTVVSVDLVGSNDFSVSGLPELGGGQVTLNRNTTALGFAVRYKPTSSRAVTGKITVNFTETDTATAPAFRGQRTAAFTLNLTGAAPEFTYTYAVQPNGNTTLLRQADTIRLPDTAILDTAVVAISIANRGTAQGTINAVSLRGPANFALAGVPFPPVAVDAGKSLTFNVRFTPDQIDPATASVQIDFQTGATLSFSVTGLGLGAAYTYEMLAARGPVEIDPNELVTLPSATVGGDKTTATIRVNNVGNADARVTAISVSGTGFAVAEAPFLPYVALAGTSFTVVVSFTPSQPGKSTGRLRIGADNFNLEATTIGSNVTFSYSAGGDSGAIQNAGTIVFTPTAVGATSTAQFVARNEGTAPSLINSISVTSTGTVFASGALPPLPVRLEPGGSVTISLTFTPVTVGANTGTLRLDTNTFTLSGSANPPATLPEYSFQGASASVDAQQQPAIGFSLNAPYPLALNGVLTLTFTSDVFANDPAVQFASGGRTIPFTIPANTRQALFPNNATQMRLQTGTVAGAITLTPSFTTTAGGIDLTPATPPALTMRIPQAAPQLLNVVLSARTSSGFTLLVTGYATGRSLTQMDFQLTPTAGENVSTGKISMNVDSTFSAWYQSTASQAFGSLFTASIPFTLAGELKNVKELIETIQSVSVTLTNRQGVSTAKSVNLQ
jgi:Abnormal spindle-like microcephaly-assoc'd, ASPM-SPD-2-Hydin